MASSVTTQKFFSKVSQASYDHDPGATTAVITSPDGGTTKRSVDMANYEGFAVIAMTSVSASSSGITKLEIVAAEDSAMSTNLTVVKDSGTVAADAVGDCVVAECTVAEIKSLGSALRYVAARLTCSNSGDEAVVTYTRHSPRFAYRDLTANQIS
jgi:hypothetical protein